MLVLPSSNMQQARSKKLMVSLCGLALSSVFLINNKAVVHADSVNDNGAQSDAISWDSDQDDSQVVTQQTNASQTKTEQSMPQKADNSQQNATQSVQNGAEMSTVRSSSEQRSLINQTKDAEISSATDNQSSRANLVSKVDDAQADKPVTINNPSNNQVHVHYVKTDGTDAGVSDFVININKSGTGSYQIPSGYQLASGDGKYNTNYSSHTTSGFGGYSVHADDSTGGGQYIGKYDPTDPARNKSGAAGEDGNGDYFSDSYDVPGYDGVINTNDLRKLLGTGNYTYIIPMSSVHGFFPGERAVIDSDGIVGYSNDSYGDSPYGYGGYGSSNRRPLQSDHVYRILSGNASSLGGAKVEDMGDVSENDGLLKVYNQVAEGAPDIIIKPRMNYNTVTNSSFSGDSVKSVNGNTVNVVVTKPQNVDPATDARMKATATRTIKINFPGSIPPSYKNIVNDKGELIQTVTFTRTGQEDALTGNLIDNTLTPWKSNNQDPSFLGFPERTLPRIPGYTLKITPVQA